MRTKRSSLEVPQREKSGRNGEREKVGEEQKRSHHSPVPHSTPTTRSHSPRSPRKTTTSKENPFSAKDQTRTSLTMSDKCDTQDKPLIILQSAEDYPTWKSYTISRLQQQSCDWATKGRPQPTLVSVRNGLIEDGFDVADLRTNMLVAALRDEKKDHLIALTKSAGIIKELVDKNLQLRAKYSLRQMKPRGSNRNLHKAASASASSGPKKDASPPPELES